MSLIQLLVSLSNTGIKPEYDVFDRIKIRIMNNFYLLSVPIYLIYIGLNLITFNGNLILFYTLMGSLGLIILGLNAKHKHYSASLYVIIYYLVQLALIHFIFGSKLGVDVLFLLLILSCVYLFEDKKTTFLFITVIILTLVTFKYIEAIYPPVYDYRVLTITPILFFTITAISITHFARTRLKEIKLYSNNLNQTLSDLRSVNTELVSSQQLIETQNERLELLNTQLQRFAYIASHDLKSPIRNISSFVNLAKREIERDNTEKAERYLDFVGKSANHMNRLVSDILAYSKVDSQIITYEPTDLNEILDFVMSLLNAHENVISDDLPVTPVNMTQFQLLFQNLIANSIKYNIQKKPIIEIINESCESTYRLLFIDNGIGVEPEYKESIFEMFTRLHSNTEYEGTGIGLSICRRIMDQHQGHISLTKSEVGIGSQFEISWPKNLK